MDRKAYLEGVAERLWAAYTGNCVIEPPTAELPDMTLDEAYAVQLLTVQAAEAAGRRVVGKKIGLTSKAMQDYFGIDTPDYGHLYDAMIWGQDEPISLRRLYKPKIETELAFVLVEDLIGPGVTLPDVIRASAGVMASFEIIDSRIRDWRIKVVDSVADNASAAGITLGAQLVPLGGVDLRHTGMVLEKNGVIVETAAGAAVMGNPALAVAWLANKLGQYGVALKKGEIILSGSLTKALDVAAGDVFTAHFGGVGPVKAMFTE